MKKDVCIIPTIKAKEMHYLSTLFW